MKKKLISLSLLITLVLAGVFFTSYSDPATIALQSVKSQFQKGLDQLHTAITTYKTAVDELKTGSADLEQLQQTHLQTRLAFKEIAFLLEYLDDYSIRRYVNGPPLPAIEKGVPEVSILEPLGLQVLDELLFSEDPLAEKAAIIQQVEELHHSYQTIYNYQSNIKLHHRNVFESIRLDLVRVFTLGLTGFDTPGSGNAIPEAIQSLKGMQKAITAYMGLIQSKDVQLAATLSATFDQAITYLEDHDDFDALDRLTFLKNCINPLYDLMYQAHKALGIETVEETSSYRQPVNYKARNIFANDFLNADYYADLNKKDPLHEKKLALGRLLFFDPILSVNQKRACASCHNPELGFSDGLQKSLSLDKAGYLQRNAPGLINSVYAERYFYDLREEVLERQMNHVILDKNEFDSDFFEILEKLGQSNTYVRMFEAAYPDIKLSKTAITNALAYYVASLSSFNSPFDQYVRGEKKNLDDAVKRGFNVFMGKGSCGTCHFAPLFSGTVPPLYQETESEVLGVPETKDTVNAVLDPDPGRFGSMRPIDEAPFYLFSFKTTTVRNVGLTAPYMHNGVYTSLEEVVDFYNRGGGIGLGIPMEYQTLPDLHLNLSPEERKDLVAFMQSLTDTTGLTAVPSKLPDFEHHPEWNQRKIGGEY